MSDASRALAEFHATLDVSPRGSLKEICRRRITLHIEENDELSDSLDDLSRSLRPNREELLEAVARELCDNLYLCYGTAELLGLDLDAGFTEIHAANMRKFPDCDVCEGSGGEQINEVTENVNCEAVESEYWIECPDCNGSGKGKPILRNDGKLEKNPNWYPPNLKIAIRS